MSGVQNSIGIGLTQTGVVSFTGSDNNTITLGRGISYTAANVTAIVNNQTASRTLGTVYQNTSISTLEVIVYVTCTVTAAGSAYAQAISDANPSPSTAASYYAGIPTTTVTNLTVYGTITFFVQPNNYYKVVTTTSNGTVALGGWWEASF